MNDLLQPQKTNKKSFFYRNICPNALFFGFLLLMILTLVLFAACPPEADPGGINSQPGLAGTVWAGPEGSGGWCTLIFRAASENPLHGQDVVVASTSDTGNVSPTAVYTYDSSIKMGVLDGIGAFTISDGDKTIRFDTFKDSGPLELKRLSPDAGNEFPLINPMPANLKNTVWASEGIRTNDWVTFVFMGADDGNVRVFHAADNTQWPREYSYNDESKTGSIANLGYRDGGFSITDKVLKVANFYGHGIQVDFRRVR
jgi:hypothetical protein